MAIETKNIMIYGSQRNTDTDDGGGQYNGKEIKGGDSNNLFDDTSMLDRTLGDVSMRKVFFAVNTNDTDKLMGAVAFIAKNPEDENVSVSLFSTESWTDTRNSAKNRVENYLAKGGQAAGSLLDTAYKGMKQFQTALFTSETAYTVGTTLVLAQNEGKSTEQIQFVRITAVSTRTAKIVVDQKEVEYQIATYTTNSALEYDFVGLSASQWYSATKSQTLLRETIVADTGKYYASVKLSSDVSVADTVIDAKSSYIQIIPSAETEIPVTDVSASGENTALIASNDETISTSRVIVVSTTQACYIGCAVLPNTLSCTVFGAVLSDKGGQLVDSSGTVYGTINYQYGLINWTSNAGTGTATINFVFKPAATPSRPQETLLIKVTKENRALNWIHTLAPIPAPKSLKVSYVALGKVYTLTDNGSGVLSGTSTDFGSGTISYETGTVLLTCGALPDVGSGILMTWGENLHLYSRADMPISKAYFPLKFDADNIVSGSLSVTWLYNSVTKIATDDGSGNFTGDATGKIDYAASTAKLMPTVLPNGGTTFNVSYEKGSKTIFEGGSTVNSEILITGTGAIKPNSVALAVSFSGYIAADEVASGKLWTLNYKDVPVNATTGNLVRTDTGAIQGTIDYVNRTIKLNPSTNFLLSVTAYKYSYSGYPYKSYTYKASKLDTPLNSVFTLSMNYRDTSSASNGYETPTGSVLQLDLTDGYAETILSGSMRFLLGDSIYFDRAGLLYRDPSVTTGSGTYSGTAQYSNGLVKLSSWNSGASNAPVLQALVTTMDNLSTSHIGFRSSVMPLRSESVTIRATKLDGGTITVTPSTDGTIDTESASGWFNWDYGMGEIVFRKKTQITETNRAEIEAYDWYDQRYEYTEDAKTYIDVPIWVLSDSIVYNAVGYSSIPLDESVLGLSATRLPTDGRVPIFRTGDIAVISSSKSFTLPDYIAGKTYALDDQRISFCELEDSKGTKVDTSLYTVDYDYGKFTLSGDFALGSLVAPFSAKYRYHDMGVVSDVQINGQITLNKPITHNYSASDSIVASGLVIGDMFARYANKFVQATWSDVFNDAATGASVSANYNDTLYPIEVTNNGAIQERWAIVFTSNTAFRIIGEYSGQIATGTINNDFSPINPITNAPYFTIKALGWGTGWASGNVLRFDTKAATYPVWCIRTVKPSEPSVMSDSAQLMLIGDIDRVA
ncbi:hypothetical protein [Acinetobacter sp. ANC 3791]|uniref:hypothetical protein n=1 Tax=Acinetobacter sp. ANC 3791 TaxID=2529836 RepID=UPI00103DC144|nr:hypothetical protein [Acinetobacter sp. ANC 3791]TCB83403.1 hypothetical protein E0H90_11785 [Acinetobacter sp. ANC 3791]